MGNLLDEARIALHGIWQRRWLALCVAWAVCLAGWFVVSQLPTRYESRARVYVQLRPILPTDPGAASQQQQDIDRLRQTLTAAVTLEKVVRGTDLARTVTSDRDVAARVASLQNAIKITADQPNQFSISVTASSGKLARQIAQKLIDLFVENNLADNRDQSSQSLQFLDQQLAERQKQLQDADAKRADFQARFLGSLPGTGSLDDRIGAARAQLAQIQSDLAAAQSSLNAVSAQMAGTPAAAGGGTAALGPARARLQAIQGQLADARAKGWTDNHPDVIALKAQLAAAQAAARSEPMVPGAAASANPLYMSLRSMQADKSAQVAALVQRRDQIEADLARLQARMAEQPGVAAEQNQIDREYQVLKDQYDKLLTDREQMKIAAQAQHVSDAVKFKVTDPPTEPTAPTSPKRALLLTAVLVAGLGAGVAAAFAIGQLRTSFATPGQLERASGLPVIGSIGEVVTRAERGRRRRLGSLFAGGLAALVVFYIGLLGIDVIQRGMGA